MTFYDKRFHCLIVVKYYKDWITLVPTIDLHINACEYQCRNFRIELHWICFHVRFMWLLKKSEVDE